MPIPIPHLCLLIALDDDRGTRILYQTRESYLLCGAFVAELQMRDRLVAVEADGFIVRDAEPLPGALGKAEERLRGRKHTLNGAVSALYGWWGVKELRSALIAELIQYGVLREEVDSFLFLKWRWRYPTENEGPERRLEEHLRHYIATVSAEVPPSREDLVLSLLRCVELLGQVWGEDELAAWRPVIEERTRRAPIGVEVRKLYLAAEAAAAAAAAAG